MSPVVAVKQFTHEHSESPPTENYLNLPASRTLQWNHRLRRCLMPRNVGYIGGPGIAVSVVTHCETPSTMSQERGLLTVVVVTPLKRILCRHSGEYYGGI